MRMFLVASIATALMACGTPMMDTDTGTVFDSGTVQDVVIPDTGTPPADTNTHCDFTPGPVSTSCRILSATCNTGPVDCGGGVTYPDIICHCASIHMGMQVWQCDNACPADGGLGTDAATE